MYVASACRCSQMCSGGVTLLLHQYHLIQQGQGQQLKARQGVSSANPDTSWSVQYFPQSTARSETIPSLLVDDWSAFSGMHETSSIGQEAKSSPGCGMNKKINNILWKTTHYIKKAINNTTTNHLRTYMGYVIPFFVAVTKVRNNCLTPCRWLVGFLGNAWDLFHWTQSLQILK